MTPVLDDDDLLNQYELINEVLPRYFRMHPQIMQKTVQNDSSILHNSHPISFVNSSGGSWFAAPGGSNFTSCATIEEGIFPMDVASSLPVLILEHFIRQSVGKNISRKSELKVLDLCCCPGAKLQLLSDTLEEISMAGLISDNSIVVGVDISVDRLRVCKSILSKWAQFALQFSTDSSSGIKERCIRQLLFNCDGTLFSPSSSHYGSLIHDSHIWHKELLSRHGLLKHQCDHEDIISSEVVPDNPKRGHSIRDSNNDSSKNDIIDDNNHTRLQQHQQYSNDSVKVIPTIRKRANKSSRQREAKQLRIAQSQLSDQSIFNSEGFDYVLVDAECSHSGSYRHMSFITSDDTVTNTTSTNHDSSDHFHQEINNKRHKSTITQVSSSFQKPTANSKFNDPSRRDTLQLLQQRLIQNGFSQLRNNGILVYSTCSEEGRENEEVVQWLLDNNSDAELIPCPNSIIEYFIPSQATSYSQLSSESVSTYIENLSDEQIPDLLANLTNFTYLNSILQHYISTDDVPIVLKNRLKSISERICKYMSGLSKFPVSSGAIPGTVKTGHWVGMSGLFVAVIRKKGE